MVLKPENLPINFMRILVVISAIGSICSSTFKYVIKLAMGKVAQTHIANFSPETFAHGLKSAIKLALHSNS